MDFLWPVHMPEIVVAEIMPGRNMGQIDYSYDQDNSPLRKASRNCSAGAGPGLVALCPGCFVLQYALRVIHSYLSSPLKWGPMTQGPSLPTRDHMLQFALQEFQVSYS